jgi:hypothetical protein
MRGYVEAFVFVVITVPVVATASMVAEWMCRRFDMRHVEETELMKLLSLVVMLPLLIIWNGRRWRRLRRSRSDAEHTARRRA